METSTSVPSLTGGSTSRSTDLPRLTPLSVIKTIIADQDGSTSVPGQPDEQHHQVDDEQQHDGDFEGEHPAIHLVLLMQAVEVVHRAQLLVDGAVPVGQMETL